MSAAATRGPRDARIATLVAVVLALYPFTLFPHALWLRWVAPDGFYLPNYEAIHLMPRLLLLAATSLLAWRSLRLGGAFERLLVAHAGLVLLSAALAPDPDGPALALLGSQRRLDGPVYQLLLVGFGLLAVRAVRAGFGRRLVDAAVAASVVAAVPVLLQRFGLDPVGPLLTGVAYGGPAGTFSHAGMAAGWFLPALILAVARARRSGAVAAWSSVAVIALALGTTQNRTSLLAAGTGLALLALVVPATARRRVAASAAVAIAGLALGSLLLPVLAAGQSGSRDLASGHTLRTRLQMWRFGAETLARSPRDLLFGGGADAFRLALIRDIGFERQLPLLLMEHGYPADTPVAAVRSERIGPGARDLLLHLELGADRGSAPEILTLAPTLDKAHNLLLDRAIPYGLPDALLWGALYLLPAVALARRRRPYRARVGAVALAALAVYYLTWFPVVQAEPLHLVVLAVAWAPLGARPREAEGRVPWSPAGIVGCGVGPASRPPGRSRRPRPRSAGAPPVRRRRATSPAS